MIRWSATWARCSALATTLSRRQTSKVMRERQSSFGYVPPNPRRFGPELRGQCLHYQQQGACAGTRYIHQLDERGIFGTANFTYDYGLCVEALKSVNA